MPHAPRLFVDLDDVLAETTATLLDLLAERTGRRLELEDVRDFDLARAFDLEPDAWADFMTAAHADPVLGRIRPRPGAARALGRRVELGWRVEVMTGRPPSTEPVSRAWLARHAIPHHGVEFVDKYGRPDWRGGRRRATPLAELAGRRFHAAVEDSLAIAAFLAERLSVPVAVLDRPWNRDTTGVPRRVAARLTRCRDWVEVDDWLGSLPA